jgi:cell division protein FtsW
MASEAALRAPRLRLVGPHELSPAAARARAERSSRRSLLTLTFSVAALTVLGLVMVLSASSVWAFSQFGSSFMFFERQLVYAAIGTVAAIVVARMRYQVWQRAWKPIMAATIVLLLAALTGLGTRAGGSSRWIDLRVFSLQPSEIAKFAVVVAVASILTGSMRYLHDPIIWGLPLLLVVGATSMLILVQPDLGTMMVIAMTVLVMVFVAGARLRLLGLASLMGAVAALALVMGAGYRRSRLLSFLHPWADPHNTGYQIVQSLLALGSGHLFGVGLGASRQKWSYVPNAHTDFIFSIMGEELGLAGEIVVLALFGALLYAGIRIALRAPDTFGRILAGGITAWLGLQALINLGAVTGVLPITGVPLPFMSFGGSSLIVSLLGIGVLASIARAGTARGVAAGGRRRQGG